MKRLLTLLLAAVLLIPAAIPAEAATLSPALDVLAGNFVMVKAGLSGSDILFTPTDFAQAVGLADFTSLTVTSLPPAEDGALYLGETKLKEGQTIRQSMLKYLTFRAADAAVSSSDSISRNSNARPAVKSGIRPALTAWAFRTIRLSPA